MSATADLPDTNRITGPWLRAAAGAGLLGANSEARPTIFTEMTALANSTGAINLGQGFPDDPGPQQVLNAARRAISEGRNQYPPLPGIPALREAIAAHQQRFYGLDVDPDTEIQVTMGATEAMAATLLALVEPGDEVVTIDPFYDAYAAIIGLSGGTQKCAPLTLDHDPEGHPTGFSLDIEALAGRGHRPDPGDHRQHPAQSHRHHAEPGRNSPPSWTPPPRTAPMSSPTRSTSTSPSPARTSRWPVCRGPGAP
jgi:hypothetical protein